MLFIKPSLHQVLKPLSGSDGDFLFQPELYEIERLPGRKTLHQVQDFSSGKLMGLNAPMLIFA